MGKMFKIVLRGHIHTALCITRCEVWIGQQSYIKEQYTEDPLSTLTQASVGSVPLGNTPVLCHQISSTWVQRPHCKKKKSDTKSYYLSLL